MEQRLLFELRKKMKSTIVKIILGGLVTICSVVAYAIQPITIVVPYAAGGGSDVVARALQKILITDYKIETTIEYKTGAGGEIGHAYVANHKQPNTVIILANNALAIKNAVPNNNYSIKEDLVPVAYLGEIEQLLVVGAHLNVNSLLQLQKLPQTISYASAGIGSAAHFKTAMLAQTFKQPAIHIPYKGTSSHLPDMIAGRVDLTYSFGPVIKNAVDNGQLVPLAISSDERSPEYPNIPTLSELGLKNYDIPLWMMLFANTTADKETIKTLQSALKDIANDPKKRSELKKNSGGITIDKKKLFLTEELLLESVKKYQKLIDKYSITLE